MAERVALDWAKAHPEDPRSPKALFRVVRASRRGCRQGTAEAKEAFLYLHEHYKKSPWAKKATRVY
jgi:TolA-binding protein